MARRRDQSARRRQLVDAAARAVLERGAANARLRDIADLAGLTPASVLYYYPDINELLAAVFEKGTETYSVQRRAAVERADGHWERLSACIRSGVPFPGEPETTSRVLYELVPLTFRNQVVAARQQEFFAEQADLYCEVLEGGAADGTFRLVADAPFLARALVALEDGYGIEVLAGSATAEDVQDRLLAHARLLTGAEPSAARLDACL
jgi:AcrR family transcriptional regulator